MQKLNLFFKNIHFPKEIIILCITIIILLYPLFLYPYYNVFPKTDINIYSAWKHFLVESYRAYGYIPLWNPYLFGGAPFIGNSQVAFFYPINLIYFIVPIEKAFNYVFILDYALIGYFTFIYARLLRLSKFSSLISAICMIFSGAIMKQLFLGHIAIMDSIAWFPLLLYIYEKIIQKPLLKYSIFSGIIFGLMLLTGNAQIPLYAILATSLYFYVRLFQEYGTNFISIRKALLVTIITLVLGVGIASIQLIPTLELSHLSVRSHGIDYQFASDFSLHPKQILGIVFPSLFGSDVNNTYWGIGSFWGSSIYSGIIPFFLCCIALFYKRNKYTYALFSVFLFSILYSFGKYGPFFGTFYKYFPIFNNFRVPTRFLFIYSFSFSIFVGFGIEFIKEAITGKNNLILKSVCKYVSLVVVLITSAYAILYFNKDNILFFEKLILKNSYAQGIDHNLIYSLILKDTLTFIIFACVFLFILIQILFKKLNLKTFYSLITLFIILDFFIFYSQFYAQESSRKIYQFSKEISFIKKDESRFRIFPMSSISSDITSNNGLENILGYDPLYLESYRNFLWNIGPHEKTPYESSISINQIKNLNNLKLLNVKYIISLNDLKTNSTTKVFQGKYKIYKINNSLPRAFINYVNTPDFSVTHLEKIREALIKNYEPNKITLNVNLDKSGYLILSEMYYPGWIAYDNNKLIKITKSNKIFRSVYLTKGKHTVIFKYDPKSYKIGELITLTTIFIIIILLIYLKRKKLSL